MTETPLGMVPAAEWAQTEVHKASAYFCARCSQEFAQPQDYYEHECSGELPPLGPGSRVRLVKAVGSIKKIEGDTAHVEWDTGAKCPLPLYWLNREESR